MVRRFMVVLTGVLLAASFGCAKRPCPPAAGPGAAPGAAAPGAPGAPGAEMAGPGEEAITEGLTPKEAKVAAAMTRERFESEDVYFEYDSSDITPAAAAVLDTKVAYMKANPGLRVMIEGHCDERGSNEYNLALGERRAHAAKRYLVNGGVASARLDTVSYGEERPADPRSTEEAWAKNRRAHFVITR